MKKLVALIMALVMVMSVATVGGAKVTPVSATVNLYNNESYEDIYNQAVIRTVKNHPSSTMGITVFGSEEKPGWFFLTRTTLKTSKGYEDIITNHIYYSPQEVVNAIGGDVSNFSNPNYEEILSINGKPAQNFTVDNEDASKGGIALDRAQWYCEKIKDSMSNPNHPRNVYNSTSPTGNGKMVSLYVGGLVAAYYTANSVKADFFSARPVLKNKVVYVPLKDICSYLGATVKYDSKTQTTKIVQGSKTALIKTGSKTYTLNGQKKTLDGTPYISDGSLMVPISFMSNIGYTVKTFNGKFGNKLKFDIYN